MRKRLIAVFLFVFAFVFVSFKAGINVDAKSSPTFTLISIGRGPYTDQYTFSSSSSKYSLGWAGDGNESYLVINNNIKIKATASISSNNYTEFKISDSEKKLNSSITSLKFTNVVSLNSSGLPSGKMSGNPGYNIDFSNATSSGFGFDPLFYKGEAYASDTSCTTKTTTTTSYVFGSNSEGFKKIFDNPTESPLFLMLIYVIVWFIGFIAVLHTIGKMAKEKILSYSKNKSVFRGMICTLFLMMIVWFVVAFLILSENPYIMIHGFGGLLLMFIYMISAGIKFNSIVNNKISSINRLSVGMTRDEILNVLDLKLEEDNTIKVIKGFRNGNEKITYTLSFDENNKLTDIQKHSVKRWTEKY